MMVSKTELADDVYELTQVDLGTAGGNRDQIAMSKTDAILQKNYKVASNPKVDLYNSTLFNFTKKELVSFTNPYARAGTKQGKTGNPWCSLTDSQMFKK